MKITSSARVIMILANFDTKTWPVSVIIEPWFSAAVNFPLLKTQCGKFTINTPNERWAITRANALGVFEAEIAARPSESAAMSVKQS